MHGEIFASFNADGEGPSIQVIEIIRYVYASFGRKKSHWDYQYS
jgi:hypothetical protein